MPKQNVVAGRRIFVDFRMDSSLCYSHRFSPNILGKDTCLSSLRECHLSNIFLSRES